MSEGLSSDSVARRSWAAIRDHLGLTVSALLVVLTAYEVLAFARWDQETAQAILQEQGTAQVLTGTLLELVATMTPGFLIFGILTPFLRVNFSIGFLRVQVAWAICLISVALIISLLPIGVLLGLGGFVLVGLVLLYLMRRFLPTPAVNGEVSEMTDAFRGYSQVTGLCLGLVFVVVLAGFDPWLPRENLEGAEMKTVGYVLSSDSHELVFVDFFDGEVRRLETSEISRRSVCEWRRPGSADWFNLTLTSFLYEPQRYPSCFRRD